MMKNFIKTITLSVMALVMLGAVVVTALFMSGIVTLNKESVDHKVVTLVDGQETDSKTYSELTNMTLEFHLDDIELYSK